MKDSILVCPETLQPLEHREGGWWSPAARRLYPERDGLTFMAYPEEDAAMIAETMEEEREWQGTSAYVDRDREFLEGSVPAAVDFINLITRLLERTGPIRARTGPIRALELGSGSGWVSWLLAEAGYDTWLCDFEANSLAIGQLFRHEQLHDRVVTDARYCPFPDDTFDVVVMKEFVHHVEKFDRLFREANRVLRPGGILALMDPTRSLSSTVYEIKNPDPHKGHHITWPDRYRWGMKRAGFNVMYETAVYSSSHIPRTPVIRRARQRAARETAGMKPLTRFAQVQLRLLGGASFVLVGRKARSLPAQPRPAMRVIDPATLRVSDEERAAFRDFPGVLERGARRLDRIMPGVSA